MPVVIRLVRISILTSLLPFLFACGGGDSDSGGDSADAVTVQFQGTESVSVSVGGGMLQDVGRFNLSAVVSGEVVTLTDANNRQFAGILQVNGSFIARGVRTLGEVVPGVRCGDINLRYIGTRTDDGINGSSEGATECDTDSGKVSAVLKGTFTVSI